MKCKKCQAKMRFEHDRYYCPICSHSEWHQFKVRPPKKAEREAFNDQPARLFGRGQMAGVE